MRSETEHWDGIDYVKGVLILLVFAGHLITGKISETFPRYLLYSFHMPLFMGVSGFLAESCKVKLSRSLAAKQWQRLIRPFLTAAFVYYLLENTLKAWKAGFSIQKLLRAFYAPPSHMWYIVSYVVFFYLLMLLWKISERLPHRWAFVLAVSALISIICKNCFYKDIAALNKTSGFLWYFTRYFKLDKFVFFVEGAYLRSLVGRNREGLLRGALAETGRITVILSAFALLVLFFRPHPAVGKNLSYIMNVCLIALVLHNCVRDRVPQSRVISFLGVYSLPIYLYHEMGKNIALKLFAKKSMGYFISYISFFAAVCLLVFLLRRVSFIDRVVFGSVHRREGTDKEG